MSIHYNDTMRLPKAVQGYLDEVFDIVDSWPIDISDEHVIRWILQFDSSDFDIAMRILKHLIVLGNKEINHGLEIANSKLNRKAREMGSSITVNNTIFAGIGDGGKSGWMIAYHFRMVNSIPEFSFLSEEILDMAGDLEIENLVMIDDFIGSGDQATKEIKAIKTKVMPLGIKNFFMLSVAGMSEGVRKIESDIGVPTFCAFEYDDVDTVMSFDSEFYYDLSHREKEVMKNKLEKYGLLLSEKRPLGYGDTGGLLAFHYNTPNNTLPVVWSSQNGWLPLFRRIENVPNIDALIPKLRKSRESRSHEEHRDSLKIFVEGLSDERFFRNLLVNKVTMSSLGVRDIEIITLGSSLISSKLLENLVGNYRPIIFILEDDTIVRKPEKSSDGISEDYIVRYYSIFDFIDTSKMFSYEPFRAYLARKGSSAIKNEMEMKEEPVVQVDGRELEKIFKRSGLLSSKVVYDSIINNIRRDALERLISNIREKISRQI